jgi:hypothetical protein
MIQKHLTPADFERMLDALEEHTDGMPKREVMKKVLQLQFERDCAMSFADAFCTSTGNITDIVKGFHQFKEFIGDS